MQNIDIEKKTAKLFPFSISFVIGVQFFKKVGNIYFCLKREKQLLKLEKRTMSC